MRKRTTTVRRYGPYTYCTARTPYFFAQKIRTRTITRTGPPKDQANVIDVFSHFYMLKLAEIGIYVKNIVF